MKSQRPLLVVLCFVAGMLFVQTTLSVATYFRPDPPPELSLSEALVSYQAMRARWQEEKRNPQAEPDVVEQMWQASVALEAIVSDKLEEYQVWERFDKLEADGRLAAK